MISRPEGVTSAWARLASTATAFAFVIATAACSSGPSLEPPSEAGVFQEVWLQASEAGASPAQLDLIARASERGEVTLPDVYEALAATFECFDEGGVAWEWLDLDYSRGFPIPSYGWGGADEQLFDYGDACLERHSFYVEMLYQVQPSSVEAEKSNLDERMPEVVACLRAEGVEISDEASPDEVELAIREAVIDPATGLVDETRMGAAECLTAGT